MCFTPYQTIVISTLRTKHKQSDEISVTDETWLPNDELSPQYRTWTALTDGEIKWNLREEFIIRYVKTILLFTFQNTSSKQMQVNDKASFKIQLLGYLKSLRTCFPRDIVLFV